jgi:long-subunit acyl-CoA synthetase (AMP-forming)
MSSITKKAHHEKMFLRRVRQHNRISAYYYIPPRKKHLNLRENARRVRQLATGVLKNEIRRPDPPGPNPQVVSAVKPRPPVE